MHDVESVIDMVVELSPHANRRPVFTIPAEDLVARLITAAWPILADPAHREKEPS